MTIGEKIKKHRKAMKLTQTELGERLGVQKNAVSKWETGRVEDIPTGKIRQMAEIFDVPAAYLMQDELETPAPDSEQARLAGILDLLNDEGRRQLLTFAKYLSTNASLCRRAPEGEIRYIRHYLFPAAAGYASPIEGEEYVLEPRSDLTPAAADFAVTISGDSRSRISATATRSMSSATRRSRSSTWACSMSTATCCASSSASTRTGTCIF